VTIKCADVLEDVIILHFKVVPTLSYSQSESDGNRLVFNPAENE
jgi:hypothetical protein